MRHHHGIRTITTAFVAVLGFGFVSLRFGRECNASDPRERSGNASGTFGAKRLSLPRTKLPWRS